MPVSADGVRWGVAQTRQRTATLQIYVNPRRLGIRYGYAMTRASVQPASITAEELERVEDIANDIVLQNSPVTTRLMAVDDAIASGARALFGEKYGDEVRVVAMGEDTDEHDRARHFSVELCGGTHVARTGDIGFFKIVSESALASGVRRIEALTGAAAESYVGAEEELLRKAAAALKAAPAELPTTLITC